MVKIKVAVVLGTRPEIIRMSPIIRYMEKLKGDLEFFVIHTGQHYDYEMDSVFFKELELSQPKYNIKVGSGSHGEQTSKMILNIEKILLEEKPDATIVFGDTNSGLAGALSSSKIKIPVIHIESGCRLFDRNIPEEINRVCMDHMSRLLFPPDSVSYEHLIKEGIAKEKIYSEGNPLIDACLENYEICKKKSNIREKLGLEGDYAVLTMHRGENVDDKDKLERLLTILGEIDIPIVFPIHPRTRKMVKLFKLDKLLEKLIVTEPLGYLDFLNLIGGAKVVFTDSGGIQVESNILGKPCVVLRERTEWMLETEAMSSLVSDNRELILKAYNDVENTKSKIDYSKHKGSSKRIIDTCLSVHRKNPLKMSR